MNSVNFADMDICLLALEQTSSINGMKMVLPYGVKNRLKLKNWLFIKKELPLAKKRALDSLFNEEMIKSFFFPDRIYIIKVQDKLKLEIRESSLHTYIFEKVGESDSKITEIMNGKPVLDEQIGFDMEKFYRNILLDKDFNEFNELMRGNMDICTTDTISTCKRIHTSLEYSDYTLEIYYSDGVDILVWNIRGNIIEFCITENRLNACKVKIGEFLNK